jgi:hypothetical protein
VRTKRSSQLGLLYRKGAPQHLSAPLFQGKICCPADSRSGLNNLEPRIRMNLTSYQAGEFPINGQWNYGLAIGATLAL